MENTATEKKLENLRDLLRSYKSALLAFSGGVDSSLLARVASDALDGRLLLATATSPTYTPGELEQARELATRFGARLIVVDTNEFNDADFLSNPPDRCYICKKELYSKLDQIRMREGLDCIIDGSNADDIADYRPGSRAAREFSVRSPLREIGLTKADIRELSRALDLPTWNQPARACLASRFPYGTQFTEESLRRVAEAEDYIYSLGFSLVRVRAHGDTARIEVPPEEIPTLTSPETRSRIATRLRSIGFAYIAADLLGYRTGSMNETLGEDEKKCSLGEDE